MVGHTKTGKPIYGEHRGWKHKVSDEGHNILSHPKHGTHNIGSKHPIKWIGQKMKQQEEQDAKRLSSKKKV